MNDDILNDPEWIKLALSEQRAKQEIVERRKGHSVVEDLNSVLQPHGERGLHRSEVLKRVKRVRRERGLPIPDSFDEEVQSAYNQHCVGYAAFEDRRLSSSKALFHSPGGKGSGIWAVNPHFDGEYPFSSIQTVARAMARSLMEEQVRKNGYASLKAWRKEKGEDYYKAKLAENSQIESIQTQAKIAVEARNAAVYPKSRFSS